MKIRLLATLLSVVLPSAALADTPGSDWMKEAAVKAQLARDGYRYVTALEADDGHWEGEAVHNGRIVEFHADPHTGRVISEHPKT